MPVIELETCVEAPVELFSTSLKNLYDWTSRIEQKPWSDKPMLLLSTSPGGRGGVNVMDAGKAIFPRMGAILAASFSLPSFYDNFVDDNLTDTDLTAEFNRVTESFAEAFSEP
jgi:chromate reductase